MLRCLGMIMLAGSLVAQTANPPVPPPAHEKSSAESESKDKNSSSDPAFPFDKFKDFSAIMVGSIMFGDSSEAHIYRSGNLLRIQGTDGRSYFIADLAASVTYGLSALGCLKDKHAYFRAFPFTAARPDRKIERVAGGQETIDGHDCQTEDVTISGGGLSVPIRLRLWEANDLQGFPIKVLVLNGNGKMTIHYKDIVLGSTDPSLFMIPKLCAGGLPQPEKKGGGPASGKTTHSDSQGATQK